MTVYYAARRTTIALFLAAVVAALPGMPRVAAAAELGVPSRLLVFLPYVSYVDHPFNIYVWIADDGQQLVKEGTSATVTLAVDPGQEPRPVLSCPGGLSAPSKTSGPNAGLAVFAECTFDRAGVVTLTATASNVVSTIVPAPTVAPHAGVPLQVLPSIDAPQESIRLTLDGTEDPYVAAIYGQSVRLRVAFMGHGVNQPFQLQESPRTTSTWRPVADLVTDPSGVATLSVRPDVSTWYRAVFTGSANLAAGRSNILTALVRAVATQRPVHGTARVINRGTTIRLTTTVRPLLDGLVPMKVGFQLYHRTGGRWRLASLRTRPVDAFGVARINITFGSPGDWYVRSYAKGQLANNSPVDPDGFLVALGQSEPTPIARFRVR